MAETTTSATAHEAGTTTSGLRRLYLIRAVFSIVWVALIFATTSSLVSADKPSAIAAVLLVVYPLWDAVATLLERRLTGASAVDRIRTINVILGIVATVAMIVAVFTTIGSALLVFGIWALLSGALQLTVAIRRRRALGAQWPMIISGGLSVVAGASFAIMSASSSSGLSGIAGYSAFGAFWFVVAFVALTVRSRRAAR
jgi:uncharacterized membrane protein HdeD (DUF308 family)